MSREHGGGGAGLAVVGGADGGDVRGAVPVARLPDLLHPGLFLSPGTLTLLVTPISPYAHHSF